MSLTLERQPEILPYPYKQKMLQSRRRLDKTEFKRSNAFSYRSLNSGCDVGKPRLSSANIWDKHIKRSPDMFKILYDRDMLPFQKSYRGNDSYFCKLAWFMPISEINPSTYLPMFISGLLNERKYLRQMAHSASIDIIRHAKPQDLVIAIPSCISSFRYIFRTRKRPVIIQGLDIINMLALRGRRVADELARYIRDLFHDAPRYMMRMKDRCRGTVPSYSDYQLHDLYMDTMKNLEQYCSPSIMGEVVSELRFVSPTYEAYYDIALRIPPRLTVVNPTPAKI